MSRVPLIPGAALLLALVFPMRSAAAQRGRSSDRDYRSAIDTSFAFDRGGTLSVGLNDGTIVVTGWSRDQIRVHATSDDDAIRFDASASRATLEVPGYRGGGDARFEVTVPVGVRVIARTQSGDVSVTGTKGEVEVHTQSGDIHLADALDRVAATTLSGDLEASALSGDVQLHTVSGDVTLDGLNGELESESVSGTIAVRHAVSRSIRAHTTSGDVEYDGTIDPNGRYELVTHSGDVKLTIPVGASAQLSVSTWSGTIDSDFPITLRPGEHGIGSGQAKRLTFEIGSGGARINAETFSGDITISSTGRRNR